MLGERFSRALVMAAELHQAQRRKGTNIPYVAHLLGVCAIVLEEGGDDDLAIAALLHDAIEDQGSKITLDDIGRKFGSRVVAVVKACSDTDKIPKPPWRPRKEKYIEHIRTASGDVLLVSLADKLYNARSILSDHRRIGDAVFDRFNANKEDVLWYYRELAKAFDANPSCPEHLLAEYQKVIAELDQIII